MIWVELLRCTGAEMCTEDRVRFPIGLTVFNIETECKISFTILKIIHN